LKPLDPREFLVEPGRTVRLDDCDPGSTSGLTNKGDAKAQLRANHERLSALQDVFYAAGRYALLVLFQGMDAAGKDGAIKHVMSGVNPQGVNVTSFKTPSTQELAHDYLWRCAKALPELGRIGIFNRSYYEELTVVRVHAPLLERERLPPHASGANLWEERCADIAAFERHLSRNGTLVVKFFLHLSKGEQRKRLLDRIDTPEKNWKLSAADIRERGFWASYQRAYEDLLTHTSTAAAPWHIIPADHKWFARVAVAKVIVARLEALDLKYPQVSGEERTQLLAEREKLVSCR
jgi:PPK2 family polyphosphate:nucleotide phosphotransferase